jgi:hypothetical protein
MLVEGVLVSECASFSHAHHLTVLGSLFDLGYNLLLLVLQTHALSVQLAYGLVQHSFILPQHFCKLIVRIVLLSSCWKYRKVPAGVLRLPISQSILRTASLLGVRPTLQTDTGTADGGQR